MPGSIDHQDGIDGVDGLFQLAQLQMQGLFRGFDLLVGKIADDSVDAGERQVDGLEYLVGVFGDDVQGGRELLIGVGKGIVIGDPACIGKNRQRNGDRCNHHGLQQAIGRIVSLAHLKSPRPQRDNNRLLMKSCLRRAGHPAGAASPIYLRHGHRQTRFTICGRLQRHGAAAGGAPGR
jgi:hypothetical protein